VHYFDQNAAWVTSNFGHVEHSHLVGWLAQFVAKFHAHKVKVFLGHGDRYRVVTR
jgi:hypothetical protein